MNTQHHPKERQIFWNIGSLIFFVLVLVGALYEMKTIRGGFLVSVPPFDAVLLALAAFRVTRFVVYDNVTSWFREFFVSTHEREQGDVVWWVGLWSSLAVVSLYFVVDWAWSVIFVLAVAGVGSLLQLWANVLGLKVENLKLDTYEKELRLKHQIDHSSLGK